MSEELKDKLLEYYGELLYLIGNEKDYFVKLEHNKKMKAINVLLGLIVL